MRRLVKNLRVLAFAALASAFVFASPALAGPGGGLTRVADLDGDGISDMTVANDSNAKTYGYLYDGSLGIKATGNGVIQKIPSGWSAIALCDINGDLDNDLLVQNASNGKIYGYILHGTTVDTSASGIIVKVPSGWGFDACADVNGDGNADLIIQKDSNSKTFAYLLEGAAAPTASGNLLKIGSAWAFLGMADLNADNISDMLVQNVSNQKVFGYVFVKNSMDFPEVSDQGVIQKVPTGWEVIGTGDVTGDGIDDLEIQNTTSGVVWAYVLSGLSVSDQGKITKVPTGWAPLGFGDVTGNKTDDLIIGNESTNKIFAYVLTGTPPTVDDSGQINKVAIGWEPLTFQYAVPAGE